MTRALVTGAAVLVGAGALYLASSGLAPLRRADLAAPEIAALAAGGWVEAGAWDFANGLYPEGWIMGEGRITDGALELSAPAGASAYYFLPISHQGSFRLETVVRLVDGTGVHLITRRRPPDTRTETGIAMLAGRPGYLRHHVGQHKSQYWVDSLADVAHGGWHELALEVGGGRVAVYLDGQLRFERPAPRLAGAYYEPHLAVEGGVARFRSVRVLDPAPAGAAPLAPESPRAATEVATPAPEPGAPTPGNPLRTVERWAQAWSEQRVEDYLALYDEKFEPARETSLAAWRDLRRRHLTAPRFIELRIDDPQARRVGDDRVEVRFVQSYSSDRYSDVVTKTLVLIARNERWQIVEERVE